MATRETRAQRGRRRGSAIVSRTLAEIRVARVTSGVSQRQLAHALEWSQSAYARFESGRTKQLGLMDISQVASVLGYEISLGLHPIGDAIRDKGQLACARRFADLLSDDWHVTDEALLPGAGQLRAWDKLLRLMRVTPPYLVGVDIDTRVMDVQAIVRRTRARERDGHVDAILIVLADTAHNRLVIDPLRDSLGGAFQVPARQLLVALRAGSPLPGSGVILV